MGTVEGRYCMQFEVYWWEVFI